MGELSAVSDKLIDSRVVLKAGAVFAVRRWCSRASGSGSTGRPHTLVDSAHTSGQRRPRLFDRDRRSLHFSAWLPPTPPLAASGSPS